MKIPWLVELIYDPRTALDLRDDKGDADHGKVMGFFAFVCFMLLAIFGRLPSVGHTVVLVAASFGAITFRTFLKSRTVTSAESISRLVTEKRDTDGGFQPTP